MLTPIVDVVFVAVAKGICAPPPDPCVEVGAKPIGASSLVSLGAVTGSWMASGAVCGIAGVVDCGRVNLERK